MTSAAKKILNEARALPEQDRAALVDALNESLETPEDDLRLEWKAEIARRIDAVERGISHLIPGDEVEGTDPKDSLQNLMRLPLESAAAESLATGENV